MFSQKSLKNIARFVIQKIHERTIAGIDADGEQFVPYSTTPFALPSGAVNLRTRALLKNDIKFFKKKGKLWIIILGGYKALKSAAYDQDGGTVNMTATGKMLTALAITNVGENSFTIGFNKADAANKAYYHNVAGVGKKKTIRRFLGITKAETISAAEIAASELTEDALIELLKQSM